MFWWVWFLAKHKLLLSRHKVENISQSYIFKTNGDSSKASSNGKHETDAVPKPKVCLQSRFWSEGPLNYLLTCFIFRLYFLIQMKSWLATASIARRGPACGILATHVTSTQHCKLCFTPRQCTITSSTTVQSIWQSAVRPGSLWVTHFEWRLHLKISGQFLNVYLFSGSLRGWLHIVLLDIHPSRNSENKPDQAW